MMEVVAPPSYFQPVDNVAEVLKLPTYSVTACGSERVLQSAADACTPPDVPRHSFSTDHMHIDLGVSLLGLQFPTYGLGGVVKGAIKFKGERSHVERVTVALEGKIVTTTSSRGALVEQRETEILSRTVTLYAAHMGPSFPWHREHSFELPVPDEVNINDKPAKLPPTYSVYLLGTTCMVSYQLKIDMVRKGIRRHESQKIPILYFPKSRPALPPTLTIPHSSWNPELHFAQDHRVKTVEIPSTWPSGCDAMVNVEPPNFYLTVPVHDIFVAGEHIPFMLTMQHALAPGIMDQLSSHMRISLRKRIRLHRIVRGETMTRDITIGGAEIHVESETPGGAYHLKGRIAAGQEGKESSWAVEGAVAIEYFIRFSLNPSPGVALPTFYHEEKIKMATDLWGTMERELLATGGLATPALGLCTSPPRVLSRI